MPKIPRDTCPTCGTVLGPLHDKDALRRCTSCSRINPRGFYYCGYCAAPMETTAHRAELAEVAAPPGGWPSLTREMIEVRFFMDRGELDEAFEMLAVLRDRYPGHPELVEFSRGSAQGRPRPDTQVNRVVDSVLSSSASLGSAMPRRAAPTWKAPEAGGTETRPKGRTQAHEVVPSPEAEAPVGVRKRVLHSGEVRQAGSFPAVGDDVVEDDMPTTNLRSQLPSVEVPRTRVRTKTDKHAGAVPPKRARARPPTLPQSPAIDGLPTESTEILSVDMTESGPLMSMGPTGPIVAPPPGLTVAVPTLQPPRPFVDANDEPDEDDGDPSTRKNVVRKRALKSRKRSGRQEPVEAAPQAEGEPRPRRRPARFGQHVLVRLGGKD